MARRREADALLVASRSPRASSRHVGVSPGRLEGRRSHHVRAAGVARWQQPLLSDLGRNVPVRVWTDSSAAIGSCQRSCLGKLRHIQTQFLWLQERVNEGQLKVLPIRGKNNPADVFTKAVAGVLLSADATRSDDHLCQFGCQPLRSAEQRQLKIHCPRNTL